MIISLEQKKIKFNPRKIFALKHIHSVMLCTKFKLFFKPLHHYKSVKLKGNLNRLSNACIVLQNLWVR